MNLYVDFRKHYGLSLYESCKNYVKVFKCMVGCKSIGFQIFRMNRNCKCSCHEMKTSTILPYFKWRTNGTTRFLPKLQTPKLYEIVGTLFVPTSDNFENISTTISSILNNTKDLNNGTVNETTTISGNIDKNNGTENVITTILSNENNPDNTETPMNKNDSITGNIITTISSFENSASNTEKNNDTENETTIISSNKNNPSNADTTTSNSDSDGSNTTPN